MQIHSYLPRVKNCFLQPHNQDSRNLEMPELTDSFSFTFKKFLVKKFSPPPLQNCYFVPMGSHHTRRIDSAHGAIPGMPQACLTTSHYKKKKEKKAKQTQTNLSLLHFDKYSYFLSLLVFVFLLLLLFCGLFFFFFYRSWNMKKKRLKSSRISYFWRPCWKCPKPNLLKRAFGVVMAYRV